MEKLVRECLSGIVPPEMVEGLRIDNDTIRFNLVFREKDADAAKRLKQSCREALAEAFPDYRIAIVDVVKEKPRTNAAMPALSQENLKEIGSIIAIASGKGGVGKSMVAVNLAITLARKGYKVGVADADIYGPSIPKMTGTEGIEPEAEFGEDGSQNILPVEKYGVKWMSIGYFARRDQALIWRGPMASNALKQMILQVAWGELDFLLIDLPPGTGDIHISLVSEIPLTGAIIVTTPQDVAVSDVEKGIGLFRDPKVDKHIFGIVENMSWFTPAELPDHKYYIFGQGGGDTIAAKYNLPVLARIPLVMSACADSDNGTPAALHDGEVFQALNEIF